MLLRGAHPLDHRPELVAAKILETPSLKRNRSKRSDILELPSLKRNRSKSFHQSSHTPRIRAAASTGSAPLRTARRACHAGASRRARTAGMRRAQAEGIKQNRAKKS